MNDMTLKELKTTVERAVRPVRATMVRKRKIREELLAHLMSIFEEELGRLGNESAALDQSRQRFGDPKGLSEELRRTVPLWDRCLSFLENSGYRADEPAWHLAAKHFPVMLLIYLLLEPTWDLAHGHMGNLAAKTHHLLIFGGAAIVAALLNVILSLILAPLANRLGTALSPRRRGRIVLAVLCGLVVLCGVLVPVFIGAAILFFLMARQAVKEWRYQEAWT